LISLILTETSVCSKK